MKIQVSCYAGYRGEETPRMFTMGERTININEITDRWLAPDHRYFKVRGDDNGVYILRHDPRSEEWEMTYYSIDPRPFPEITDLEIM